jgi:Domain of unknown function (DUF4188)
VQRETVDLSAYPDLVVIYLGMRIRSGRGVLRFLNLGRAIRASVNAAPDGLLLHENLFFSPIHGGMRQYWRDFASLEAWTRTLPHQAWWRDFLRDSGGTGFWHEPYSCAVAWRRCTTTCLGSSASGSSHPDSGRMAGYSVPVGDSLARTLRRRRSWPSTTSRSATTRLVDNAVGTASRRPQRTAMTRKADFNAEEWSTIADGPLYAGMHVTSADRGGTLRESLAMGHVYQEARAHHGESELLDELIKSPPSIDPERVRQAGGNIAAVASQQLRDAITILEAKATPAEIDAYKRFVMTVAQAVASAHKEGGFLGIGGKQISDAENQALDAISTALGAPPAA